MLVLSRRLSEKIVFPGIGTAVQVVAVKPGLVRLGIEAPPDVTVLREELADQFESEPLSVQVRRRLDAIRSSLSLLRRQLAGSTTTTAEAALCRLDEELRDLHRHISSDTPIPSRHPALSAR